MKIYTIEQIRCLENLAIQSGISGKQLMQEAANAALCLLVNELPETMNDMIVFCGTGHNGGDGYTLAKLAAIEEGYRVRIRYVGSLNKLSKLTQKAMEACQKMGLEIKKFDKNERLHASIYVDALLGIGIKNNVSAEYAEPIKFINNREGPFCLSLDVPSGIDANTGEILGIAVQADTTITFIGQKTGLLTGDGYGYSGDIAFSDLKIPQQLLDTIDTHWAETIDPVELLFKMPFRKRHMHKSDFGHVLIIGGEVGMSGAPLMAGLGALRSGAGLVTLATHPQHANYLNIHHPELMCHGVLNKTDLTPLIDKATVIAIGPGLGQNTWGKSLFDAVLKTKKPLVVDADALNILAKKPIKKDHWIITPHPGEAARLLGTDTSSIQNNRYLAVSELQQCFGGIAILKGCGTLIKDDIDDIIKVCSSGNPGMATAGMGDILTGVIAGLIAQHIPLHEAAECAVYFHAAAGDAVADNHGMRGMMATDLLPYIQKAVNFDPEIIFGKKMDSPEENDEKDDDHDFFDKGTDGFVSH